MWMRWLAALLPAIVICAAGCTPVDTAPEPGTLAVVLPSLDGRFQDVADDLTTLGEAGGYQVEVHGTDGDIPAQVTTVGELLDRRVDVLVVWPIDTTSLTPTIDSAPDGTVVVSMGEAVRDTANLDAHVAFDAYGAGVQQAELLLEGLGEPGDAPYRIELVLGSPDDPDTADIYAGAMSVLKPAIAARTVVIGSGETTLDAVSTLRENAQTAASRLTRLIRDDYAGALPDGVLASSDRLARGAADALLSAGAVPGDDFPVVTGRGCQLRSLAGLVDGRQYASLLEDPRALAQAAMAFVTAATQGGEGVELLTGGATIDNGAGDIPAVLINGTAVRAADIDEVVIGSGYWSRERVDEAIAEFGLAPAE